MKNKICFLISLVLLFNPCFSQEDAVILNQVISEDSASINALTLYPHDVRNNILEICAHPEALVKLDAAQRSSKEKFKGLLLEYSKEDQQKIWDLTRYPGLVDSLVIGGKKSKGEIADLLKNYPSEIHETTEKYGISHYNMLVKIAALNKQTDADFKDLISVYPKQTQTALKEMLKYPEVLSILNENMRTTVSVGEVYKSNPTLVLQKLDSLNFAITRQNAKDLAEWKNGLEKNPEAKQEYEASAKEYAKKQGYSEEDLVVTDHQVVVNYVCYPYPYWYGYPWWWDYPHWYPYPYWYDWGFYYGPYGMVYIGFPSWYFTHWYFFNHPHHYHYPHFSDYCVGYYYGHRGSVTGVHRGVSEWVHKNEPNLPKNFLAADAKRPDRLKEFGKFEMEYAKSGKDMTRDEFLKANAASYPSIRPVLNEKPRPRAILGTQPKPREYQVQPSQHPPVKFPRQSPTPRPVPQTPKPQAPQPKPQAIPQKVQPKKDDRRPSGDNNSENKYHVVNDEFIRINEAQTYHKYFWNSK